MYSDPLGDTTFVNNTGGITSSQTENGNLVDNFVYMTQDDGSSVSIGELGGEINIDVIYSNIIKQNAATADDLWDL